MRWWLLAILNILILLAAHTVATATGSPELIDTLISDSTQNWFGDNIVPVGDQNGDGFDDFLVSELPDKVYLYLGGNPPNSNYFMKFQPVDPNFFSSLGDINGDGYDDFALLKRYAHARFKLALYYGGPALSTTPVFEFGDDVHYPLASNIIIGNDVNHNGTRELICRDQAQQSILFFELTPVPDSVPDFILNPPNVRGQNFGYCILSEDYNDDGWPDLATDLSFGGSTDINGSVLLYWGGPQFDTIPDLVLTRADSFSFDYKYFGSNLVDVGDINYDGYPDIYVDYRDDWSPDSLSFLYWGGPGIDNTPDITFPIRSQKARLAGDINHDGYNDLITGTAAEPVGYANIYLGGPEMDNIPDVHIDMYDFPGFLSYFAHEVTGLGDINGDGIDDFAVASLEGAAWPPLIFLYSGWDGGTDVPFEYDPTLPSKFVLDQNYPNPFNLSTTIEFDLPEAGKVELGIYNVLGETVRILIDSYSPAGKYRLSWDGKDSTGKIVSSGVYIYRLSVGDAASLTRKMLLVK